MKNKMTTNRISLIFLFLILMVSACSKNEGPTTQVPNPEQPETGSTDGVIRILAIGNSFSEDAVESYLYELAKEKHQKVIIGNLYLASSSLAQHKSNIENNSDAYAYRKIDTTGVKDTYRNKSIAFALAEEPWDYISFQEGSANSGRLQYVQASLPAVFSFVKANATNPHVKYIYHQTWAYAQNSNHVAFQNYNKNQLTMYNAIVNVSQQVKNIVPIDIIVPAGTAIQNGRTSSIGDNFNRDGYHLSVPMGRYTAACTWFEAIFNYSPVGMIYKPEKLSASDAAIAQNAAHLAISKPYAISTMSNF